ncbi:CotH kinase family protein [Paenibacillus mesotrionivorans]|uniref:CotH kinase family protein n=1 Tax=Paenibacillus mesotrionivorans TaxID=3160968 RepID=A0ACC7NXM2_9BACL
MKSKTAVPVLVILFVVMLAVGLYGKYSGSQEALTVPANAYSGKTAEELSETVFPKEKVIDVKITVDEADFQDMLDNASLEEYKMASVEYNGTKFDNVGIRTKGNLSLRSVVQMQDSDRYSFKLSFDEYVDNQTLAGISKINLNNNYSDASYMREFLTYELAEEMGLPTPGHSYVNVYINGKLWGFYLAVEQVGDAYLERNFGNSYGALYKGEMTGVGSDLSWLGDDLSKYTGLAQKSKSSNGDVLIEMLEELNNGTDYESVLNVDNVLKYIALNVATNNMDSYLGSNKQNYYLYEDEGIFNVLPWDYNMAFGGMGGGMGGMGGRGMGGQNVPTGEGNANGADAAGQAQANAGAAQQGNGQAEQPGMGGQNAQTATGASVLIDEPTQGAVAERPLIAKLLAVDEYKERYHAILKEISEGFLSETKFNAKVDGLAAKISAYVENDPTSFYTYEEYLKGVEQLKTANTTMITSVIQQLNGTIASTNNGQGSGGGMGGGRGMGGMRGGAGETNGQQNGQNGQQQGGIPQQGNRDGQQQGGVPQQNGPGGRQQQGGQMIPPDFGGEGGGPQGGMPGMPGGPGGQQAAQTGGFSEAVTAGALLLVMLAASWFILRFRRQH